MRPRARPGKAAAALTALALALAPAGFVLLAARPVRADEPDALGQLMALMAQRRHGMAGFEETQYLAVLRHPARSTGELRYDAPDHLEQRTLRPHPQSAVLDHDVLTLRSGQRQRTVRLQDYPQVAPLIDSLRAVLAGDRAALARRFTLDLTGDLAHWQLVLSPLDADLAGLVQRIRLDGERDAILRVEVQQSDGDRSLMKITPRE